MLKWKTKDGQKLLPSEMNTFHIKNCMKIIERRFEAGWKKNLKCAIETGWMVTDEETEQSLDNYVEMSSDPEFYNDMLTESYPIYEIFQQELEKRGE